MAEPTTTAPAATTEAPQYPAPSPAATAWLQRNPAKVEQFEAKFGPGSAAPVLEAFKPAVDAARETEQAEVASPVTPPAPKRDALDYLGDVGQGLVRGYVGAIDETSKTVASGINYVAAKLGGPDNFIEPIDYRTQFGIDKPVTIPGSIAEGVGQFATGLISTARLTGVKLLASGGKGLAGAKKVAGVAKQVGKVAAVGAVVDFTAFDPYEQGISDLVERLKPESRDAWYTALSTDKNDSELEARLKKAAEGLVVGGVFDGLGAALWATKLLRAKKVGDKATAEQLIRDVDGELADPVGSVRELPPGATVELPPGGVLELPEGAQKLDASVPGRYANRTPGAVPEVRGPGTRVTDPSVVDRSILPDQAAVDDIASELYARDAVSQSDFTKLRTDKLLQTPAGALRVLSAIEDRITEQEVVKFSGKDFTRAAADQAAAVGLRPEDYIARIPQGRGAGGVAVHVLASQKALSAVAEDTRRAFEALGQSADPAVTVAAAESLSRSFAVLEAAQFARAEAGRALRVLREPRDASAALTKKLLKLKPDQLELVKKMLVEYAPSDPAKALRALQDALDNPSKMDYAIQLFKNSVLTGTGTHIVNVTSNSLKLGNQHLEGIIAGLATGDIKRAAASGRAVYESWRSLGHAVKASKQAFKQGSGVLDPRVASNDNGYHLKNLDDLKNSVDSGNLWQAHIAATKTLLGDGALRLLGGGDELFKQIAYRGKVAGDAWSEGYFSQRLRGKQLDAYVQARVDASVDPLSGRATDEAALAFARETTFTQELRKDTVLGQIGTATQTFVHGDTTVQKLLQLVVPFVKTPTNILDDFWQRSPANLYLYREMTSGDPKVRGQAIARFTTGASLTAVAVSLVQAGMITGGQSADPEVRKLQDPPYSVKIGGKWYSYNRFDPAAAHIGLLADAADLMRLADETGQGEIGNSIATMLARQFRNKTYLRGLTDLLNGLSDPDSSGVELAVQNIVGAAIPSIVGSFKDDDYVREVRGVLDAIRNRIPGLSENLPPRRNVFGEPILASELGNWQPIKASTDTEDPTNAAIVAAFEATGRQFGGMARTTDGVDWTEVKAPHPETGRLVSAYDRAGEELAKLNVRDKVASLVQTPGWSALSSDAQANKVSSVISQYREMARKIVLRQPEFAELAVQTRNAKLKRRGAPKELLDTLTQ